MRANIVLTIYKWKKTIGVLSVLLIIPRIIILFMLLFFFKFPFFHMLVLEQVVVILCGILGGVILAITGKYIYILGVALLLITIREISQVSAYVAHHGEGFSPVTLIQAGYELTIVIIIGLLFWRNWRANRQS
jgi:hypothetical protein